MHGLFSSAVDIERRGVREPKILAVILLLLLVAITSVSLNAQYSHSPTKHTHSVLTTTSAIRLVVCNT